MRQRRYLTPLLIFMLSLSMLLVYAWWPTASRTPVALAHAFVIGSDPVDGSTVSSAPAVVRIFFNEAIGPGSVAHVFAPDGHVVDAAPSSISRTDPRELDTPLATPGSLPQGGYTVRWTALSDEDGHTTHGVIGFNVGQSSVGLPGETILGPSTSNILPQLDLFGVLSVAWDWLVMLALTFWVGILVMEGLVLARPAGRQERTTETGTSQREAARVPAPMDLLAQARKQSIPLQWLSLSALLVGEIITLILRAAQLTQWLGGGGINLVALRQLAFETNYGHLWLVRLTLIVVALGLLRWTTRQQESSTRPITSTKRSSSSFSRLRREVAQQTSSPLVPARGYLSPRQDSTTFPDESQRNDVVVPLAGTRGADNDSPPAPLATSQDVLKNVVVPLAGTRETGTWLTLIWLVLAGVILLTIAFTSDAAQLAQPHASAVVLDWLYLAAQSMWFGALAYLGYVLLPLLLIVEPHHYGETFASLLRRLTPPALGTLGVLLVSGLFLSEFSLSSAQQLLTDPYGRALLVKIVLIVLMLMFSVYVLFVTRPTPLVPARGYLSPRQDSTTFPDDPQRNDVVAPLAGTTETKMYWRPLRVPGSLERTVQRLGQMLKFQSWLGAGALLCAALMAFYAPPIVFPANSYAISTCSGTPRGCQASPSTAAINAQMQKAGNLTVTLVVLPGRVDYANTVVVTINDSQGNPVTDAQVQLSTNMELMDMGTAHATVKGGNPTYIATFNKDAAFSMSGAWDITVRIQRPNQVVVQTIFKVTLA